MSVEFWGVAEMSTKNLRSAAGNLACISPGCVCVCVCAGLPAPLAARPLPPCAPGNTPVPPGVTQAGPVGSSRRYSSVHMVSSQTDAVSRTFLYFPRPAPLFFL